jgi:hypothetical protein
MSPVTPPSDEVVVARMQSAARLWYRKGEADSAEEAFVRACLELAATDESAPTEVLASRFERVMHLRLSPTPRRESDPDLLRRRLREALRKFQSTRSVRELRARRKLSGVHVDHARLIVNSRGEPVIYFNFEFLDFDAVIELLIVLLDDPNAGIGRYLRRCALSSCDRLFISRATSKGGPRPRYCGPEHQALADRQDAPIRMARKRRKDRKLKAKSTAVQM